jgi:hypothetical protein
MDYAKRCGHILETGDASELMKLLPRNKQLALTALANLAKFTGRDDLWLRIRQKYDLKWLMGIPYRASNASLTMD